MIQKQKYLIIIIKIKFLLQKLQKLTNVILNLNIYLILKVKIIFIIVVIKKYNCKGIAKVDKINKDFIFTCFCDYKIAHLNLSYNDFIKLKNKKIP